jgi:hypothetical protein
MECTLATLIACFSWSNLYIDTGLLAQDAEFPHMEQRTHTYALRSATETVTAPEVVMRAANPYGRFALGYQVELPRVTFSLEVAHVSSLATADDRGVNSLQLRARWYPFR